ncbi:beta family protein [Pseudomonas sp. GX19020]|uniref:beta family protein n=1 Tax=Pseudomonas sp. GX19020 TaxID=2942277 RepID=UPI00201957BB|nr:beta family protein [Pseudomonas sp. GX19020]MCL4069320.1 beta family protein [Pseudomonas sp. GX19020]
MENKYHLILKTGQAEIKAFKNLTADQRFGIVPIVELTRGRKNHPSTFAKTRQEYNFVSIQSFVGAEISDAQEFFLDVTRVNDLSSAQTNNLRDWRGGYRNWVDFVTNIQVNKRGCAPIIQVNPPDGQSWDDYAASLCNQFDALASKCQVIGYRASAKTDSSFDADLIALQDRIESHTRNGGIVKFFLDYDYIRPGTGDLHAVEAAKILDAVFDIVPQVVPVVVSTSFPSSVTDIGGEDSGQFSEEEVVLHAAVSRQVHNKFSNVIFGDYGSINPTRNDAVTGANGWRPRIDYPFAGDAVFYHREKRLSKGKGSDKQYLTTYSHHYRSVASKVVSDDRFINDNLSRDATSWGVREIRSAAGGQVNSSSPSHWISVRMNIHIQQQLKRLKLYSGASDFDDLL